MAYDVDEDGDSRADEVLTEIEAALEELAGIEAADDFHAGVSDKVESMREQFDTRGSLSERQIEALENMLAGVRRWLEN
mgnify:CR=1 FL=1